MNTAFILVLRERHAKVEEMDTQKQQFKHFTKKIFR